jgi:hypothetical protein
LQPRLNRWQSRQAQRNSTDYDQGGTRRFSLQHDRVGAQ